MFFNAKSLYRFVRTLKFYEIKTYLSVMHRDSISVSWTKVINSSYNLVFPIECELPSF